MKTLGMFEQLRISTALCDVTCDVTSERSLSTHRTYAHAVHQAQITPMQVSPVVYESNDNKSFADVAAATYCDSSLWHSMQRSGIRVLQYIALSPVQYGVLMSMQHVCWPAFANLVNASFSEFLQSYARL
jgi:hypothetical protein